MEKTIIEGWKDIAGYEGLYEVSDMGNVRRLYKTRGSRPCKQFLRNNYLSVGLSKGDKVKSITVHTLVAVAFIPNPENKPTVNHKKGVKTDNRVSELEWATRSEQIIHANKTGLFKSVPPTKKGDKLSDETRRKMSISRRKYLAGIHKGSNPQNE